MADIPELVYTDGRGLAEIVRLVLSACSIEFKEDHIKTREKFLDVRKGLPFGQVPILRINGKNLVQSCAIVRHLARTNNLYGKDENERTLVDTYFDGTRDFYKSFGMVGFTIPLDKVKENTKDSVDKYLPFFEQILKSNGSNGHLVGHSLTLADLGLLEALLAVKDYFEPDVFEAYPEIKKFLDTVCQLPFYERYSKKIRKPKNSEESIKTVRSIYAF